MVRLLAALGALCAFGAAGALAVVMLRRPRSTVLLLWRDGKDPTRRRHCSGAKSVIGVSGVYVHMDRDGECCYVGQSVNVGNRMYQESKEIMSQAFHRTIVYPCPRRELDARERDQIADLDPYLNRTRGNGVGRAA